MTEYDKNSSSSTSKVTKIIQKSFTFVILFSLGFAVATYRDLSMAAGWDDLAIFSTKDTPAETLQLDPLWQAWNLLESKFVTTKDRPTDQEKVHGLIEGLAKSYRDPYTEFFNEEELARFNENVEGGSFSGIGIEIGLTQDGLLRVVAPLKNTPAEKAGLRSGDIIIQIDETNVLDISIDEAVTLIRGEAGSTVELTVLHEGDRQPTRIEVVRADIQVPILTTSTKDGVFIISIYSFSANVNNLFQEALIEYSKSNTQGLIIDLRNNPGGYLNSAVEIGSWFSDRGQVLVREKSERSSDQKERLYRSKGYELSILDNKPVVVLVNNGSASASEILAGIIQDYGVGVTVGDKTFGKGSVQELIPLSDGSAIKITTSRWYTPKGNSISEGGLTPDVLIKDDIETVEVDEQLNKAIEIIRQ